MSRTVDYYYSLASPWAYLGHAPFMATAARHRLQVNHKPMFLGRVFAETGGQPLSKRHPARQRYRLVELQRWREKRGAPLNLHPRHWPFEPGLADRFVIAIVAAHGDPDRFLRRAFAGIWAEERNLADPLVIAAMAEEEGLDSTTLLEAAEGALTEALYALNLENAIERDVFGSPAYVVDGEVFWGQDRIELLEDALAKGRRAYRPEENPSPRT